MFWRIFFRAVEISPITTIGAMIAAGFCNPGVGAFEPQEEIRMLVKKTIGRSLVILNTVTLDEYSRNLIVKSSSPFTQLGIFLTAGIECNISHV